MDKYKDLRSGEEHLRHDEHEHARQAHEHNQTNPTIAQIRNHIQPMAAHAMYMVGVPADMRHDAITYLTRAGVKAAKNDPALLNQEQVLREVLLDAAHHFLVHEYLELEVVKLTAKTVEDISDHGKAADHLIDSYFICELNKLVREGLRRTGLTHEVIDELSEKGPKAAARVMVEQHRQTGKTLKLNTAIKRVNRARHRVETALQAHRLSALAAVNAR